MSAQQVISQFLSTGAETCFHGRHINPQIYADLNGSNWSLQDYVAVSYTHLTLPTKRIV